MNTGTYQGVHTFLAVTYGPARNRLCSCGEQAAHWAYQHTSTDERFDERGKVFSLNPEDYLPMCLPCHRKLDGASCLTPPDVRYIRSLHRLVGLSAHRIAKQLGLQPRVVWDILKGNTWAHLK